MNAFVYIYMIANTPVNLNSVMSNTLPMSKFFFQSPEVDSNLRPTKHTRCNYFTLFRLIQHGASGALDLGRGN